MSAAGFLAGRPDGVAGSATRRAVIAFRRARGIMQHSQRPLASAMDLDAPLIKELFGIDEYAGDVWVDEVALMKKLKLQPRSRLYKELWDYDPNKGN